jgi:hypothetical protein
MFRSFVASPLAQLHIATRNDSERERGRKLHSAKIAPAGWTFAAEWGGSTSNMPDAKNGMIQ